MRGGTPAVFFSFVLDAPLLAKRHTGHRATDNPYYPSAHGAGTAMRGDDGEGVWRGIAERLGSEHGEVRMKSRCVALISRHCCALSHVDLARCRDDRAWGVAIEPGAWHHAS